MALNNKKLAIFNKKYFVLLGIAFIFLSGCSKNLDNEAIDIKPRLYVIEESSDDGYLTYEISHNNPNEWLKESSKRRIELNRIRYDIASELNKELVEERLKSRNWYLKLDDKMYRGYDVVRFHKGDFGIIKKEKRHEPVSRFALLHGFY